MKRERGRGSWKEESVPGRNEKSLPWIRTPNGSVLTAYKFRRSGGDLRVKNRRRAPRGAWRIGGGKVMRAEAANKEKVGP